MDEKNETLLIHHCTPKNAKVLCRWQQPFEAVTIHPRDYLEDIVAVSNKDPTLCQEKFFLIVTN